MYKKFDKFITKMLNSILTFIIILVVGFTLSSSFFYNLFDFTPTIEKDYKPLFKIQEEIIEDFDNVYMYSNTAINITSENIVVYINGEDCYLKGLFTKAGNYISTEKIDTSMPKWASITLWLVLSMISGFFFLVLIIVFLAFIDMGLSKFDKYTKNKKSNKNSLVGDIDH